MQGRPINITVQIALFSLGGITLFGIPIVILVSLFGGGNHGNQSNTQKPVVIQQGGGTTTTGEYSGQSADPNGTQQTGMGGGWIPETDTPQPIQNRSIARDYTLDLSNVTIGDLPPGWKGDKSVFVDNIGKSKVLKSTGSGVVTLSNLVNQPGDFVINFTAVNEGYWPIVIYFSSINIIDENSNKLSFFGANGLMEITDSEGYRQYEANLNNQTYINTFTITRQGNVVNMTCDGVEKKLMTRPNAFKTLTSISIELRDKVGISQLSVRQI